MDKQELHDRIDYDFNYHRPDESVAQIMSQVRHGFIQLAHAIVDVCPESRDLSLAITHLEDAQRCAIAALAKPNRGVHA